MIGSERDSRLTLYPGSNRRRRTKILSLHADVPTIVLLVQFLQIPTAKH